MDAQSSRRRTAGRMDVASVLQGAFLLALVLSPLWYGGVSQVAWALNAVVFALLLAWMAIYPGNGEALRIPPVWIAAQTLGFLAVMAWAALQAAPFTPSSLHHPLWQMAAEALGEPIGGAIGLDPWSTVTYLARFFTVAVVFALAVRLSAAPAMARRIMLAVALSATLCSIYALLDIALDGRHVLFREKNPYTIASFGNYAAGPFVNSTHFAAFAGIGLVALAAHAIGAAAGFVSDAGGTARKRLAALLRQPLGGPLLLVGMLAINTVAIALSTSRAAFACVLAGLLTVGLIYTLRQRRRILTGAIAIAAAGIFLALIDSFSTISSARADTLDDALGLRVAVYRLVLQAIGDNPLTGVGLGAFKAAFPLYRDASAGTLGTWNAAHDTYLELAMTLGAPAALLLLAVVTAIALRCMAGALVRRRDAVTPIAASAAAVQLALHSLIDFPLQTDAVSIGFAALLGAGLAQSWSSQPARVTTPRRSASRQ